MVSFEGLVQGHGQASCGGFSRGIRDSHAIGDDNEPSQVRRSYCRMVEGSPRTNIVANMVHWRLVGSGRKRPFWAETQLVNAMHRAPALGTRPDRSSSDVCLWPIRPPRDFL